jgi:nitrite reductase (NADH) small subunit
MLWRMVELGPVDSLPLGEGRAYIVNDLTIAVFRQRDHRLFALDNSCPHRGGPLADGVIGAGKVICPLHARKFDLETGRCVGEDVGVRTYPVQVMNGRIVVEIGPASIDPPQWESLESKDENGLLVEVEK